ncbi:MAG: hypothetical protein QOK44_2136 [Betaproteobacteria bacterium]|jgi:hypothetical protein|nr:hypothetical protein [Betaproteobacteria bacterium]
MHRDGAVHATTVHERLDYARIVLVYHQRPERINVLEVHRHAMANRITIIAGPACRAGGPRLRPFGIGDAVPRRRRPWRVAQSARMKATRSRFS